ncbi:similar to Saccharomyces cerevisiae YKL183W LOT5 Protein of unknown function [Maudiozyma barnettii]|uniref:Protein LOT5 n=1 Tax=Maudiozyma barnettii TaxID=61262 RepID=A0A8H2ZIJ4_9SACH|nr:Lot5p [Kazachstania barnettii]CAB4256989.1 similar to Saccharomyces cerevisiae YKL183W LOT5 Protein of unknown function [Kazachstania barnettii]CAD1779360.1 similar to Saccharomyces cerevisiae YKL183W LOT5 Protein of unknown function [Kazachstania barnettii]
MSTNNKEKNSCQVIWVKPTIENVIPYVQYKRTQPEDSVIYDPNANSRDLLLGGGRDLIMSLMSTTDPTSNNIPQNNDNNNIDNTNKENNSSNSLDPVEMFILNHCIILWFDGLGHGVQIPYSSVIYHASRRVNYRNEGHKLETLLSLERDPVLNEFFPTDTQQTETNNEIDINEFTMSSVEIILTPKYSMYDRHYNSTIETLFTFSNFGINRGDDMVNNCNEALAIGLELSCENELEDFTETSEEPEMASAGQDGAVYTGLQEAINGRQNIFHNSGFADDLDNNDMMNQGYSRDSTDAGMSLEL